MSNSQTTGAWKIERNAKMQFAVARETVQGKEFRVSASGKPSSFKTWSAASRVMRRLNEDAVTEVELKAKYSGQPALPETTLTAVIARAIGRTS